MQARTEAETTAGRLFSHLGERSKLSVKDHIVNILDFVSHIVFLGDTRTGVCMLDLACPAGQ